ncbi:MAG: hypothetical protein SFU98_11000 [Leptospiraceae bacterium]|nr:hypothetical protein [Leptospiraceae bacterium]
MPETTNKSKSKKLIINILAYFLIFIGAVFVFGSFMNKSTLLKYKNTGILIPAKIGDISSYKTKTTKKSSTSTKFLVEVNFTLNNLPGSAFVSDYVTESEVDNLKEGDRVEILYLPKTEHVYQGKVSLVTNPILKITLENSLERVSNNMNYGWIIVAIGVIGAILTRFLVK